MSFAKRTEWDAICSKNVVKPGRKVARRIEQSKLDSATARKRLRPKHSAYWNVITTGCALGYRRAHATKAGVWQAMYTAGKDSASESTTPKRLQTSLGPADDFMPADGATCFSYEQARAKAIEWFPIALHKATGSVSMRRGYTVEDACQDYLRSLEGRSRSAYEIGTMAKKNIIPFLGGVVVEKITRSRVENWLLMLADKPRRKPRNGLDPQSAEAVRRRKETANRNLTVLKSALNRSFEEGKVACTGLAWKVVKNFKGVGQARTRVLSDAESRKQVLACRSDFKFLVQAALYSGGRYSELARLQVGDFDDTSNTLLIAQSKAGRSRRVFLDVEASSFFRHVCSRRSSGEIMFTCNGKAWLKSGAKGLMAEAAKGARIAPVTFHELRHTAASRWARLGLSLAEIAAQLGHADIRMTQRYAHLCQHTLAEKMRSMPALGIYDNTEPTELLVQ
jgi:integrase